MATAIVAGLNIGRKLLCASSHSIDAVDKLFSIPGYGLAQLSATSSKSTTVAKMSSNLHTDIPVNKHASAPEALTQHEDNSLTLMTKATCCSSYDHVEESNPDLESWYDHIMLQKSMLEKQWKLSLNQRATAASPEGNCKKRVIIRSGLSARQRRRGTRRMYLDHNDYMIRSNKRKQISSIISPELLQSQLNGYVRGKVSEDLLPHDEVAHLSKKIKVGLMLEKHKVRLKKRLGFEPSDNELASSLKISPTELHLMLLECSLARERLAMKNIRLVISIAQKYKNTGPAMADLVQGGLVGLLRGIEKFDPSKGFKISTYVYWWIRQGVLRVLFVYSRTVRLPKHLCERLISIRNAKVKLQHRGMLPSVDNLAECLNMSERKVKNATQAERMVISLDNEAFPSLNGRPGKTLHNYVADNNLENNPWHGFEDWYLKDEVNKLLRTTLSKREQDIISLYYGLGRECHTWEDIGKRYGLSRERVRQVGLVAFEKLKQAARKQRMEAMLLNMSDGGRESGRDNQNNSSKRSTSASSSGDAFGRSIAKIAVSQVCESAGFHGSRHSALDAFADVLIRYIRDLGSAAHFYANLSGRTACNVFDIIQGLEDLELAHGFPGASDIHRCVVGSGVVREITQFVNTTEENPFARPVPSFPVVRQPKLEPSFAQSGQTPVGKHIPDWLPVFPGEHTYIQTPVWREKVHDLKSEKIEQVRQRRKAESSLLSLQQRLASTGAVMPTPKLDGDVGRGKQVVSSNPFLAPPLPFGEKQVSDVVVPVGIAEKKSVSLLETFAPAIEAGKHGTFLVGASGNRVLPIKRPMIHFKFGVEKKFVATQSGSGSSGALNLTIDGVVVLKSQYQLQVCGGWRELLFEVPHGSFPYEKLRILANRSTSTNIVSTDTDLTAVTFAGEQLKHPTRGLICQSATQDGSAREMIPCFLHIKDVR
ncbi:hypothetical protein J5N97_018906 [Dioscorea zingiberensis]|uniref:Transcription initiation factor TFIID subunit 8 n=1 Tax=Dioscorea zingiberensis TaxID=325984 RepID=A0A9D5CE09_9LILI|nr:hypothetical protein J5N97_018906 [Dioscorea zingiberensis]